MTKHNFYVITGGPGGGKTSLLECLASKGYPYVPETAREIIKERLSQGLSPRPDPRSFAEQIFNKDWMNFLSNSASILFFDRSFMDSACLLFDADAEAYKKIRDTHVSSRYNNTVFITPPWREIYHNDTERDQSFDEAIRVYQRLENWYRMHGYDIAVLPKDTVENRAAFVFSHTNQHMR
jgi:predicted ATPase